MRMPECFSEEEQNIMFHRYIETGDPHARELLISHNLRLVGIVLGTMNVSFEDKDDFIDIGSIGLIKAVDRFSFEKKTKFITFALRCIRNEMNMEFRKRGRADALNVAVSLDDRSSTDRDGRELALHETIAGPMNVESDTVDRLTAEIKIGRLRRFMAASLDDKEKTVMIHRLGLMGREKKSQKAVAAIMGCSQAHVSRIERRVWEGLTNVVRNPL